MIFTETSNLEDICKLAKERGFSLPLTFFLSALYPFSTVIEQMQIAFCHNGTVKHNSVPDDVVKGDGSTLRNELRRLIELLTE